MTLDVKRPDEINILCHGAASPDTEAARENLEAELRQAIDSVLSAHELAAERQRMVHGHTYAKIPDTCPACGQSLKLTKFSLGHFNQATAAAQCECGWENTAQYRIFELIEYVEDGIRADEGAVESNTLEPTYIPYQQQDVTREYEITEAELSGAGNQINIFVEDVPLPQYTSRRDTLKQDLQQSIKESLENYMIKFEGVEVILGHTYTGIGDACPDCHKPLKITEGQLNDGSTAVAKAVCTCGWSGDALYQLIDFDIDPIQKNTLIDRDWETEGSVTRRGVHPTHVPY